MSAIDFLRKLEGQERPIAHLESLTPEENKKVDAQVKKFDQAALLRGYNSILRPSSPLTDASANSSVRPFENVETETHHLRLFRKTEVDQQVQENRIPCALLLLAGGSGTRMGCSGSKGTYRLPEPINETLFGIIVAKFKHVIQGEDWPLLIMTSPSNYDEINTHFEQKDFYGLKRDSIFIFQQTTFPSFDKESGEILFEARDVLVESASGNAAVFESVSRSGILTELHSRNISFVQIAGVDNVLLEVLDPFVLNSMNKSQLEVAIVTIERKPSAPDHFKVGVLGLADNTRIKIVEYSELSDIETQATTGNTMRWAYGNICNQYTSVKFLNRMIDEGIAENLPLHKAIKEIPYYDFNSKTVVTPVTENGIKLEGFIFDGFACANKVGIFVTDVFSPVKRAHGPESIESAVRDLTLARNLV